MIVGGGSGSGVVSGDRGVGGGERGVGSGAAGGVL